MGDPEKTGEIFEPAVAGFFCQKCGNDCLSKSGNSNGDFPSCIKSVRIICAEKVGPTLIKGAFEMGADGVLICGCLVGHCQSLDGNSEVLEHIHQSKMVLKEMGIPQVRLRQEWICAPGGDSVRHIADDFAKQIRELGPLKMQSGRTLRQNA